MLWDAHYDAFGLATVSSETVVNNLRFPGQYYDVETGLHYNYYRYYDPNTGRYITSDPIGLQGGLNTYGYVGGNPLIYTDPKGLSSSSEPIRIPIPIPQPPGTSSSSSSSKDIGEFFEDFWDWYDDKNPPYDDPNNPPDDTDNNSKKDDCISWCTAVLPTKDHGFAFWNCVNNCMDDVSLNCK